MKTAIEKIAIIIKQRAVECYKSAQNNGQYGDIFQIIGVVFEDLGNEVEKLGKTLVLTKEGK